MEENMENVRYGIIGIGNMGSGHAVNLDKGVIDGACLTAVCDIRPERLEWAANTLSQDVLKFSTTDEFFA